MYAVKEKEKTGKVRTSKKAWVEDSEKPSAHVLFKVNPLYVGTWDTEMPSFPNKYQNGGKQRLTIAKVKDFVGLEKSLCSNRHTLQAV